MDCGRILKDVNIRYETAGTLNADRSNAILVTHALSVMLTFAGVTVPMTANPAGGMI